MGEGRSLGVLSKSNSKDHRSWMEAFVLQLLKIEVNALSSYGIPHLEFYRVTVGLTLNSRSI